MLSQDIYDVLISVKLREVPVWILIRNEKFRDSKCRVLRKSSDHHTPIMPPPSTVTNIAPPEALGPIAAQGFASGAFRFGSISILSHIALNAANPVYRALTIQFKVFIQLSAMTLGGCIFAEKRVSEYNDMVRRRNRALERSNRAWNEERELRERIDKENAAGAKAAMLSSEESK